MEKGKNIKKYVVPAVLFLVLAGAYFYGKDDKDPSPVTGNSKIDIEIEKTHYAVPCGIPVGIYLKSDGVLVIDTQDMTDQNGEVCSPAKGILKTGDYIKNINGQDVENKEALAECIAKTGKMRQELLIDRDGKELLVTLNTVICEDGMKRIGVWVRDDTQGIGTLTYIDQDGNFGALGHGISDADTGGVLKISEGELYETQIVGIQKGSAGAPGVMSGIIYYGPSYRLGEIWDNSSEGIFGKADGRLHKYIMGEAVAMADRHEVHRGRAQIRSAVSGKVKDYEIEIQRIDYHALHKNKCIVIRVTDPDLLALTGGIVQGMSGSPIMQDGKLAGAVTHVFVDDPSRGYGIFAEEMLKP